MTILSPQYIIILRSTACHSQLLHSPIQTQHQVLSFFPIFQLYSTHALAMDLFVPSKASISLSFRHHALLRYRMAGLTQLMQTDPFSHKGNLLPCRNSPYSLSITHPHIVLAVTATSHPLPALTLSPIYVHSYCFHYIT